MSKLSAYFDMIKYNNNIIFYRLYTVEIGSAHHTTH